MSQLPYRVDRMKVEILRDYGAWIGHTDGTPFSAACISFYEDTCQFLNLEYVCDAYSELAKKAIAVSAGIDSFSKAEQLFYQMLKHNRLDVSLSLLKENLANQINDSPKGE